MNETLLKQYADFAVRVGLAPREGQTVLISAPVEAADFARALFERPEQP